MLFRQPLRGFFIATIAAVFFSIIGALGLMRLQSASD
jgi:multisubunit Na+/H+ antiporter MnhG subunit